MTDRRPWIRPEVVWISAVVLLVLVPTVVTALRTRTYEASVDVAVEINRRLPSFDEWTQHLRDLLATDFVAIEIAGVSGLLIEPASIADRVEVTVPRAIRLTASAKTPQDAARLANAAGDSLARLSVNEIVVMTRATPPAAGTVDRMLARLPGDLPPPAHPIFVAAVGFVIAVLLYYGWLAIASPQRRLTGEARPGDDMEAR